MRQLGIILSGGRSSRLFPSTIATTKQLLPVFDKPLIYYPLTTLMLAGIREYIIITTAEEVPQFNRLFKNCEDELGIKVTLLIQENPLGIADAFRIVKSSLKDDVNLYDTHALILGDNLFYGAGFTGMLSNLDRNSANIFVTKVQNPDQFGVAELRGNEVISLEEKPSVPKSNLAVTGLYFYPKDVYILVDQLEPSARGELEITDLNKIYLQNRELKAVKLPRGMTWFDTGTPDSLLEASNFVQAVQKRQGILIGSPHEIAVQNGWTTREKLEPFLNMCSKTAYGNYIKNLFL